MAVIDKKTGIIEYDDLEDMIRNRNRFHKKHPIENKSFNPQSLLRANKSASFEDFIEMVNRIVTKILKKDNIKFLPDEGSDFLHDKSHPTDQPVIRFIIINRVPQGNSNLKPRPREAFQDNDGRKGMIYSQVFDYTIQFDILASDYVQANRVMNNFESAMFTYTAFFKENGVGEIVFIRQFTDSNLDIYRNAASVRSLQYRVSIERNRAVYDTTIAEINSMEK